MKKRKALFMVFSFLLAMTMTNTGVHANEEPTNVVKEGKEVSNVTHDSLLDDLIVDNVDLNTLDSNKVSIYTYPIAVGTPSTATIGYIRTYDDYYNTKSLITLTGDMIPNFDSTKVGINSYELKIGGYFTKTAQVEVREHADLSDVGKVVGIKANAGSAFIDTKTNVIYENTMSVGITTFAKFGGERIEMLDKEGTTVFSVALTKEMIPNFDSSKAGKKSYNIAYKGFTTTLIIDFRYFNEIYTIGPVSLGANLHDYGVGVSAFDTETGTEIGRGGSAGWTNEHFGVNLDEKINTMKPGIQEVDTVIQNEDGSKNAAKIRVIVGTPAQSTVEKLLPEEAQKTLPSGEFVSIWDVPSIEGTWVFKTELSAGTGVDVWSYHNNQWLKIGEYTIDTDGNVSVAFNKDQLSPVVLVKNGKITSVDTSNSTISPTDENKTVTSPKTSDTTNLSLYLIATALSFCVIVSMLYNFKRVKNIK